MDRREALKLTAGLFAGTIIGSEFMLSGCSPEGRSKELITPEEVMLLDEIGETILPESPQSPGAREAKIGLFMKAIVEDCYTTDEQQIFKEGIININERAEQKFSKRFPDLGEAEKQRLLVDLDLLASKSPEGTNPHYFTMMKQLTVWGYFSSEAGATKALRYNPVPGDYKGCIPYTGERAWA